MNTTSIDSSKKKFPHTSSPANFTSTFLTGQKIHYLIQCESGEVLIGQPDEKFKLLWKGNVKQKITCVSGCGGLGMVYAGTAKGTIVGIRFRGGVQGEGQGQGDVRIDAVHGEPILAIFSYSGDGEKPELIAINNEGILRKYENNKYVASVKLPFKVVRALSNKTLKSKNDIAMVFLKQQGTFPYIFSAQSLISLFSDPNPQQKTNQMIHNYESSLHYEPDQQVRSQQVTHMALSNSKAILAISTKTTVTVYSITKTQQTFSITPEFAFINEDDVINIDIIDASLLYASARGISTFDVERRRKIARGLVFKSILYDIVHWAELPCKIVYGSTQASKMKIVFSQLKLPGRNDQ